MVATDHQAVVYTVPARVPAGPRGARVSGVALFGCLVISQRRVRMAETADLKKVSLGGTTAAFATSRVEGIDTIATDVTVFDIRRGRQLYQVPAGRIAIAPSSVSVDALSVTKGAALAWIQHGGSTESPGYSVHVATTANPVDRQVAAGTSIDPRSLGLTAKRVSWTENGQRHSAST